jgi:hypothetical protein
MKPMKLPLLIVASFVVGAVICACSTQTSNTEAGTIAVRVVVTRDFGQERVFAERMEVAPEFPAMAALMQVADVETAYGGGFVNGINGVRSGYSDEKTKMDWFFYINGIQSNIGALDYELHDGDVQHWDFHDWSFRHFVPSIIDGFPAALRYGFGGKVSPTVIVCRDDMKDTVAKLERLLSELGLTSIGVRSFSELAESEKESSNLVLVGLPDNDHIPELNQNWKRLGFFAYFENGNLFVIDNKGEIVGEYGTQTGLIQVTQNPWNPKGVGACENVVWLVSGTDKVGVENALDALINRHTEFQYACAVVVADGKIIKVPR